MSNSPQLYHTVSRRGLNNWVGENFFLELVNAELSINKDLRKFARLVVLNVRELYFDVVLKAYLRRKFCHASDNFICCNSFHCDRELILGEVSMQFRKKYKFIRQLGEFTKKNKTSSLYIRH